MSKKHPEPNGNSSDINESDAEFRPSFGAAIICVLSLIIFMAVSIFFFDQKMHVAMMASLGVPVLSFLPFAVFNWVVPIVSITFGFLGKFQWKTGEIKSTKTYRDSLEV